MADKRRTFSKEFKLNAVKLYLSCKSGGCKVLSRELSLNDHKMLMRRRHEMKGTVLNRGGLDGMPPTRRMNFLQR